MNELKFIKIERQENKSSICCNNTEGNNLPDRDAGIIETPAGEIQKIKTTWSFTDYWGQIRSRTSGFRMRYNVAPGLYAVGEPDSNSDVFLSANYKLSFDILRRELKGLNAWVLVLDTKGINVWCAAGKGTFGTGELVKRIREVQLNKRVNHSRLIVPQLGAVGINSSSVQKMTGFRVYFGPVYARDILAYLSAGYKKTEEMRTIKFSLLGRLILTPMEINPALKKFPLYALIVMLIFGLQPSGILFRDALIGGTPFLILGLMSIFSGAFITPLFLPFIPFRSFALKGWLIGMLSTFLIIHFIGVFDGGDIIFFIASYLFFPLASSYIALQFTGSTTFTGMSGVKRELKFGVPVYITGIVISVILILVYKLGELEVI